MSDLADVDMHRRLSKHTHIHLQVVALLEKVIPDITPRKLADYLDIAMLPPEGYSAIAAAISSGTAVLNHVGLLDIFLACISKALSVQAKAKGRSAGLLQDIGGGPKGPGNHVFICQSCACIALPVYRYYIDLAVG